jgi:formylglycine-generating enzyme required for sulfatase activity
MSGGDAMSVVTANRRRGVLLGVGGSVVTVGLLAAIITLANAHDDAAAAVAQAPLGTRAACAAYSGLPPAWREAPRAGMVRVRGGEFVMGSDRGYADEVPTGVTTRVSDFWIDRTEVTNAQFAAFVEATGYMTDAEREGGGAVFVPPTDAQGVVASGSWWRFVPGATWRTPGGPGSDLAGRHHHPVLLVTQRDAQAYARWLGRSLPTEAQWEFAAKAGSDDALLDDAPRAPDGQPVANFWQGAFPYVNHMEDGYAGSAPVGCYGANAYGLHDMIGNAWEWTSDRYRGAHQPHGNGDPRVALVAQGQGAHLAQPLVIKGGSYLCAENYCVRYRAAARHPQEANLPTTHVGFRTVLTVSAADRY